MADMSNMLGASRAKSQGRRQSQPTPQPKGAVLSPASGGVLSQIPGGATPTPEGAAGQPTNDGMGHLGSWADKVHPVDV